jgi:hypothetical protein
MNAQKIIAWGAWIGCLLATSVAAADNPAPQETMAQKALARDAVCTACHNENWRVPVLSLYQTRHGVGKVMTGGDDEHDTITYGYSVH